MKLGLWIAQGFGVGRIPKAPGTWGSAVGLLWFGLLLGLSNPALFIAGIVVGAGASVWLCGVAERQLNARDPGSVVLDEIAAMPACFLGWALLVWSRHGSLPTVAEFLAGRHWGVLLAGFAAFRLFDVWKPWPVRQSQALPGGWGVTVDDFLAAVYVNLLLLLGSALASSILR